MGIFFALMSGLSSSFFSYLMKKSADRGGSVALFTLVQLSMCVLFTIVVGPVRTGEYAWNTTVTIMGLFSGLLFGSLFLVLGKALERGPSSLMFAIVNSACVIPALLMYFIFGKDFGYAYTVWHALGAILVIAGLFWSGLQASKRNVKGKWLPFAVASFLFQVLFLSSLQYRAMHMAEDTPLSPLLFSIESNDAKTEWFLPMLFVGAVLIQLVNYFTKKESALNITRSGVLYGMFGGLANGFSLFALTLAIEFASTSESVFLFPTSAVTIILVCGVWGQILYKEKINWYANALCALGVFVSVYI